MLTTTTDPHDVHRVQALGPPPGSVRAPVLKFALAGLAALVIIGAGSAFAVTRIARSEAIRDARARAEAIANVVVAPYVEDGLATGDARAIRTLDDIVRERVLIDPVVRIKVWTSEGLIVYSDEPRLMGMTYSLSEDELHALESSSVSAEITDLSDSENVYDRFPFKTLEVYLPVETPSGQMLLLETYQRFSSVAADSRRIWLAFIPAFLGALLLLGLLQLPLALRMARGLRDSNRGHELLLQQAIKASDLERHRIASNLHDGVVQNLAGISYVLSAASDRARRMNSHELASTLEEAATATRQSIRELRSLLVDVYPPDLRKSGLEPALADLVTPLLSRDITARVTISDLGSLSEESERLIFRAAREGLRNAVEHADASTVDVSVVRRNGSVVLLVDDDGQGITSELVEQRRAEGHLGLALLADQTEQLGGRLELESLPSGGTRLRLEVDA